MDFTIIIPHKNSSKLLLRLLNTIPDTSNYQVIVVDDNSSYEEFINLQNILNKKKIELFKNEGIGAGGARNTGLKYAKGTWVLFADADDFYLPSLNRLTETYKNSNADIVYFRVTSCYSDNMQPAYRDQHINILFELYSKNKDENLMRCRFTPPWGKMIRKELIDKEKIYFEECSAGNDNWFSVNTGVKASKIQIIQETIYCVTVSSGSITTTLSKDKFNSRLYSTLRTNKFLREQGMSKYQLSILYYLGKAHIFGLKYALKVFLDCIKNGANPFIGITKLTQVKKYISIRENKKVLKKE